MSKSDERGVSGKVTRPIRSGKPDVAPISTKIERAGGRDKGEKGHSQRAAELTQHFGKK